MLPVENLRIHRLFDFDIVCAKQPCGGQIETAAAVVALPLVDVYIVSLQGAFPALHRLEGYIGVHDVWIESQFFVLVTLVQS
jgi:hypothetical protein